MKMQKYWYLSALALIGFYKLPLIFGFFHGTEPANVLLNLLWFGWLLCLIPEWEEAPKE